MKVLSVGSAMLIGALLLSTGTAMAQISPRQQVQSVQGTVGPNKPSKTISRSHQPVGTPHKVSSFAPHPTHQRVFGAPIQAPIVHNVPADPKKTPPR